MATATEKVQDAAAAAAEKLAEAASAAGEAMGDSGVLGGGAEDGAGTVGGEANEWGFFTKALVAVIVIIICFVASKVIRGENPEDKRQRLRNERRAKKKASKKGPDDVDVLLSNMVRGQPGQAPPPGAIPIAGHGVPRGMPAGAAGGPARGAGGRGGGPAALAAARAAAAAGRGVGAGRGAGRGAGGVRPGGPVDNRPKLRWDQSNEEVEIVIRVDPKVTRADVKVEVTNAMLKLSLRNQAIIAGHLFKSVDPEGCTWQIDNPGPGQPREVTITLLKAEVATGRDQWWRAPLKGLENAGQGRRPAPQPADPEMVRKAIEAIKAKSAAGKGGAKPAAKPMAAAGQQAAASAAPGQASSAASGASNGATSTSAPALPSPASVSAGAESAVPGKATGGGVAGATAPPAVAAAPTATLSKSGKGGGKKKNRKKK